MEVYGLYSILTEHSTHFQAEMGSNCLVQCLKLEDLEKLRGKLSEINIGCLAYKETNQKDFISVDK